MRKRKYFGYYCYWFSDIQGNYRPKPHIGNYANRGINNRYWKIKANEILPF